jgi:arabinose-5-phosphate isomerase
MNQNPKNISSLIKNVLQIESRALAALSETIDENSIETIIDLLATRADASSIIVTGAGKSGYVGMKFSASLASIGIRSFFFHPFEAYHGDFGRFARNDIVFLLSNSGETAEVVNILPYLESLGSTSIAITKDNENTLARRSNYVIAYGNFEEAPPLGIAPTVTTTVMLGLCDALVMALVKKRGFSINDFIKLHPGGTLGKSLLLVSDLMRVGEAHCIVHESELTKTVIQKYSAAPGRPGCATIINDSGDISGIFTDGNLRRKINEGGEFLSQPIGDVMTKNPKTIAHTVLAADALTKLKELELDQLVVVNEKKPVGLIDIQDLVKIYVIKDI